MSSTFHKLICQTRQKEITLQHSLNLHQLLLRQFKIKIHIQCINKFGNRIRILMSFLFNNSYEFPNLFLIEICVSFTKVGGYYGGSKVSNDPGRGSLN